MKIRFVMILCLVLAGLGSFQPVGAKEQEYTSEQYEFVNSLDGGESKTITVYSDEAGKLLFPVKEITESAGYVFEECSRCGKDEIYCKEDENAGGKGHYFVNWYQNLLSYSASDQVVELSAENVKVEGVTYSPADLFDNMGLRTEVDEKKKTIRISSDRIMAVYFFSSTCDSCEKMDKLLSEMEEKYPNLNVYRYNIYEVASYDLLMEYGKVYEVPEEKKGFTPSVYISDQVLIGAEIQAKLEEQIKKYADGPATVILDTQEPAPGAARPDDGNGAKNLPGQILSSLGLGFVNGLNPCSLSMFLFLLSLLLVNRDKMLRCGLSFLAGKAVMFFLLGTILYNLVSRVKTEVFSRWINLFMVVFAICFALLNLWDFFTARSEHYEKMKLQLPGGLKKLNHSMMKWGDKFSALKVGMFIMAAIGMAVATGEFLCTGQIYLSSVVIMVQKGVNGMIPTLLLAVYSIAFVLPLLAMMLIVYLGRKVFGVSEKVLEYIPWIKLASALLFVAMAFYLVFA